MRNISDCTILVVDDAELNLDIMVAVLGDEYDVAVAMDGRTALEDIEENPPDLILLDVMMPEMDGYEVCRRLKADPRFQEIPVIFVTAMGETEDETQGLELGAIDYIVKPISPPIVKARVKNHLTLKLAQEELEKQNETLELKVQERTKELALTQDVTIYAMASVAETRDSETGGHIRRTQTYVKILAERLRKDPQFRDQLDPATINIIYKSAPLHDVGKVGVPDSILLKPGKLTTDEFEIMKKHTLYGRDALASAEAMLGSNSFLHYAKEIAYSHHEKWDGSGYPEGLKGAEIPLCGRLMAAADVYDALISKRIYKPPFTHAKAVEIMSEGRGSHFDPDVIDAFLELEDEVRRIALEYSDSEEERNALKI